MLAIEIIGNLGKDAEIKTFNERRYISFSVANSDPFSKQTTWVNCLKYAGEGGALLPYLKHGARVFIRGELSIKQYEGSTQAAINCNVRELQLLGGNNDNKDNRQDPAPVQASTPSHPDPERQDNSDLPF